MNKAPTVPGWLHTLFTVQPRQELTTRWHESWLAASDTVKGRMYDVHHDIDAGTWTCNCPATVPCKHIARCKTFRAVQWWLHTLEHFSHTNLTAMQETYLARIAAGEETDDDRHALTAITLILNPGATTPAA